MQEKRKEGIHDNLNDEQKEHLKIEGNRRKKTTHDNLDNNEKEQLREYDKKGRKKCMKTVTIKQEKKKESYA